MSRNTLTRSKRYEHVVDQVDLDTPVDVIDLIARQLDLAAEANARIAKEGIVVRDMKGSVVEHPAIAIEQKATRLAADLLNRHKYSE